MKYLLILICFFCECNDVVESSDLENILFAKECDGIFEYSTKDKKIKQLLKIKSNDIFIENPFEYEEGKLIFGIRKRESENDSVSFFVKYYLSNGDVYKTVKYREKEKYVVLKETKIIESNKMVVDTFENCTGSSSSTRYEKYNCMESKKERFYTESIAQNGSKVFSRRGNIYLFYKNQERKITNFEGQFDSKFGNGYFEPKFIFDDKKILFRKLSGFLNIDEEPILYLYDLELNKRQEYAIGEFHNMKISNDGNYMLYSRFNMSEYFLKDECINNDIFIMNLKTKSSQKIGKGILFDWKKGG